MKFTAAFGLTAFLFSVAINDVPSNAQVLDPSSYCESEHNLKLRDAARVDPEVEFLAEVYEDIEKTEKAIIALKGFDADEAASEESAMLQDHLRLLHVLLKPRTRYKVYLDLHEDTIRLLTEIWALKKLPDTSDRADKIAKAEADFDAVDRKLSSLPKMPIYQGSINSTMTPNLLCYSFPKSEHPLPR